MKTLIIPDVHQRIKDVQFALENNTYDEVVFLGDWFDSFLQPPDVESFEGTCLFLKSLITDHKNRDKFIFLIGNHDINYIYTNNKKSNSAPCRVLPYYCSGFTSSKSSKFRKIFFDDNKKDSFFIKHFKPIHRSQGWTFSHAGVVPNHFPYGYGIDDLVTLSEEVWKNFRELHFTHNYLISGVGYVRGGRDPIGGVLWCDWNNEFYPSEMVGKQVCGHTTMRTPTCCAQGTTHESWNLDTCNHYGIIENGNITINSYAK